MAHRHVPVAALISRETHVITLKLPIALHKEVVRQVEAGRFASMSEFYRAAARSLLDTLPNAAG